MRKQGKVITVSLHVAAIKVCFHAKSTGDTNSHHSYCPALLQGTSDVKVSNSSQWSNEFGLDDKFYELY